MSFEIASLLAVTITAGTPILYATLGATVVEKSGVNQLGVEGLMLTGALSGFAFFYHTGSITAALLAAFLMSSAAGAIHAFICVIIKGNQIVSGLALTMLGTGITAIFGKSYVAVKNVSITSIKIPFLSDLPIVGESFFNRNIMVYASYLLVVLLYLFFKKTKIGLYISTVGQNPAAADTSGINVNKIRFWTVIVGSGISGLGGAYLSMFSSPFWTENMVAGKGWIAVALVIFSGWSTNKALFGAYLFGGITALQHHFQAAGFTISSHILHMMPYLCTIVVLVASSMVKGRMSNSPKALGEAYNREERH